MDVGGLKKPQYIHTMEKYSAIKGTNYSYKNNLNQLKDIVLREKNLFQKITYCSMISFLSHSQNDISVMKRIDQIAKVSLATQMVKHQPVVQET